MMDKTENYQAGWDSLVCGGLAEAPSPFSLQPSDGYEISFLIDYSGLPGQVTATELNTKQTTTSYGLFKTAP